LLSASLARISERYNIKASVGPLAAAEAGLDKGADALVAQFRCIPLRVDAVPEMQLQRRADQKMIDSNQNLRKRYDGRRPMDR